MTPPAAFTPEQEAHLLDVREAWRAVGLDTSRINETRAHRAIVRLYETVGLSAPAHISFHASPLACLRAHQRVTGGSATYVNPWFVGGQDAPWLSVYDHARTLGVSFGRELESKLDAYIEYAKSCGWAYLFRHYAFVSDRPAAMRFDERRLLHNEAGMAIEFTDGWGVHSWHGVSIPSDWIEYPNTLTPHVALTHPNVEQRRAACEILGWTRILDELNVSIIDDPGNPYVGQLLEVDIPDIGREKFLRVRCGTQRDFALPVPPDMQRASQAQAWLNFTTEDMYLPSVRT